MPFFSVTLRILNKSQKTGHIRISLNNIGYTQNLTLFFPLWMYNDPVLGHCL